MLVMGTLVSPQVSRSKVGKRLKNVNSLGCPVRKDQRIVDQKRNPGVDLCHFFPGHTSLTIPGTQNEHDFKSQPESQAAVH